MVKYRKLLYILILLLSICCFSSCKKKDDDPTDDEEEKKEEEIPVEYVITCHQKMLDVPVDKTIEDCTNNENIFIAIGKTVRSSHFLVDIKGEIKGSKWFIDYKQSLDSQIIYNETLYFSDGYSYGTFKKYACQKLIDKYNYYWHDGKKTDDGYKWNKMNYQKESVFIDENGQGPWGVTSYFIDDTSIQEVIVERVDNDYLFKITLDPVEATKYYKYEVKHSGGLSDFPVFSSIYVEMQMDANWVIKTVRYIEKYSISNLGGIDCESDITATYSYSDEFIETKNLKDFLAILNLNVS